MSFTFSLDLASYIYHEMTRREEKQGSIDTSKLSASVIIPAHNEAENLERVVNAQYNQTKQPKSVVVINDNSTDATGEICESFQKKYSNFIYIHNVPSKGKAGSIQYVLKNHVDELGDILYVNDGDLIPDDNCLEELVNGFNEPNVAAVTGIPRLIGGGSRLSRAMTWGKNHQIQVLNWKKTGQTARNGMYVLCGGSMAIRKDVMIKHPVPTRTQTEDLDYTWVLNENGYKLKFQRTAGCETYDVTTMKDHWKQTRRWHKGAWQAVYCHGKELNKSKGLLYTTLIPSWAESILYIGELATINHFLPCSPEVLAGIFALQAGIGLVGLTLAAKPSYLRYLPESMMYQGMSIASYFISLTETTIQKVMHQEYKWGNKWDKNGGNEKND